MPSLLRRTACPTCQRSHTFCDPRGPVSAGQAYRYCCPETGRFGSLTAPRAGEAVTYFPQGAVVLVAEAAPLLKAA